MSEHVGRGVLLGRVQYSQGTIEVILDDPLSATKLAECLELHDVRTALSLDIPDALQNELQIRRLDPTGRDLRPLHTAQAGDPWLDPTGSHLVEDCIDELGLDRDGAARSGKLRVALERPEDRCTTSFAVEVIETKRVSEELRNAVLEDVEL